MKLSRILIMFSDTIWINAMCLNNWIWSIVFQFDDPLRKSNETSIVILQLKLIKHVFRVWLTLVFQRLVCSNRMKRALVHRLRCSMSWYLLWIWFHFAFPRWALPLAVPLNGNEWKSIEKSGEQKFLAHKL